MAKICPARKLECSGEKCAWWSEFAEDCAVPLIAGILADSDICNNVWGHVYTKKDGDNDG